MWYHAFTVVELRTVARLKFANDTVHIPTGVGYLKVPFHNQVYVQGVFRVGGFNFDGVHESCC